MIYINYKNNILKVKGHANYDIYGNDIVCASVSTLLISTINYMHLIDAESFKYQDVNDEVTLELLSENGAVKILFETLIKMLKELETMYKKNIKFESEE